ncbi:transcriptional regulator XRE family [Candidatus Termititenax aidoneus]|uniref:Transcriptional regulator XRE family n=1 Tax=Termititenax aidoneus TaxID=2218524 RepID=A0A388TAQ9_TERA1|nr:transcriptional regulator XRE family [Candidatus Termititenax aidoneus]
MTDNTLETPDHSAPEKLTLGQRLKQAREAKQLDLADAASHIKIKKAFLEQLEQDEFKKLPNLITAKGFAKVYAAFLGLPVEEIAAEFNALFPSAAGHKRAATEVKVGLAVDKRTLFPNGMKTMNAPGFNNFHSTRNKKNNKWLWRLFLGAALIAGALGIFIYSINSSLGSITNNNLRQQNDLPRLNSKDTPESKQQNYNPNKVYIDATALNRTYISVIIDGRTIFQGNLERGDSKTWEGDQYIKIRATIPRNLRLYVNGKDYGLLDEQSTMQEKTFFTPSSQEKAADVPPPAPKPVVNAPAQTPAAAPAEPVNEAPATPTPNRNSFFGFI